MADIAQSVTTITNPLRVFKGHGNTTLAVAVFPDGRRMVTGSYDMTLRLWDLKDGAILKKMEGHCAWVRTVAVSADGKWIASGDGNGEVIAWNGDTGESLTKPIKAHSSIITSLDFSPDSAELATVSWDYTIRWWRTDNWQLQRIPIYAGEKIHCVRYSPSGELLAIGTHQSIQIWNVSGLERIAKFRPEGGAWNLSLAWTLDGTRLLSGGSVPDTTIREWDTSTWKQVGDPWSGHTNYINVLTINSTGTLVASASYDKDVRIWRLSDRQTIAILKNSRSLFCGTFSTDGKYVLCGGEDRNIVEWGIPEGTFLEDTPKELASQETPSMDVSDEQGTNTTCFLLPFFESTLDTTVRNACLTKNLSTAQELLTQHINADGNNHSAFANRSFVYARQSDWDNALHDALKSLSIQPSLIGYISKGIALCGRMDFKEATKAFDIAFMFAAEDSYSILLLLLVKAIALFNVNQHDEAISRIQELTSACPNANILSCHIVEAYLRVQLGINASNDARHSDAADHFAAAINIGVLSHKQLTYPKYEIFVILFGWDLASSWQTANQGRCYALLRADRLVEAHTAYKYMMDECDEAMRVNIDWSTAFQKECSTRYVAGGDAALAENAYDRAIELYSAAIGLDPATNTIFASRCKAKLGKMLWEDALDDAQKVIELNHSSNVGYELKHAALRGARRYDKAVEVFKFLSLNFDLDNSHDLEMQAFKEKYILLYTASGNAALAAGTYDNAIQLYSVVIDLDPTADAVFANRCKAKVGHMLWEEALDDAEKVTELNPSSYAGYHLKHAALHGAQRYDEAIEALQLNLSKLDDAHDPEMQAFKREYNALYTASGNDALAVQAYDRAIQLYSVAIYLNPTTDTIFVNRCKAKLEKMLWQEALLDAEKVTELDPSSYLGYDLKHAALHGAQRYDEAIEAFKLMLVKLDDACGSEMQALRRHYISPSEAQATIRKVIDGQMTITPPRLFDTSTGRLCDQNAQITSFEASTEYKELLSLTMKHANLHSETIREVVLAFFQYVMLSHRWEGNEPLLYDIRGKCVFELDQVDGIAKLQSFCKVSHGRKYRWAWSDTCCIDKSSIIELQQSINSMFLWYRQSTLTIVYLSDVLPLSKSGALARSAWIGRGWTVQEFLAPKVVLFYQKDWTLYLNDDSPNHKESDAIMKELSGATGIHAQALVSFRPEMIGAREKLRWSSMRVTKFEEDIAYSLFGIFGVHLSPIYGEKKHNALGRLLQEIIARSGDITCLDWVGKSSEFNSCLPADITSYSAPPFVLPSLSDYEMEVSVSSLRDAGVLEPASQLYATLEQTTAPRFAHQRLYLPCIVFTVTQVRLTPTRSQEPDTYFTYAVKADGLHELLVTTEDKLTQFSRKKPIRRKLLLVRPWDRNLLGSRNFVGLSNSTGDVQTVTTEDSRTIRSSVLEVDPESAKRALRLVVRLGQPFRAFLLEQQWGGEYKRIAADHDIIAQVKVMTSVPDIKKLEIL